ncbi:MAG: dethiobiotin synthase [Desulfoplanes sp.]
MMPLSLLPQRIFVTGTDTDIGKTIVAAICTSGLAATYWKPVQSGTQEGTDTDTIKHLTGLPDSHFYPPAYALRAPLSPHLAAERENRIIHLDTITLPAQAKTGPLVVEGAGGLMVPLNDRELMIDLIKRLALPVVLVASNLLGTINQVLLSLEALRSRHIPIAGVVLNRGTNNEHAAAIEHFGQVPVLAQIPDYPCLGPATVKKYFFRHFNA